MFVIQILICISIIWIYVMSCSSSRLSCVAKTLTLDSSHKLFSQIFFRPAMLTGTIDFYHFISLSLTLTLPGGYTVSVKQNLLIET